MSQLAVEAVQNGKAAIQLEPLFDIDRQLHLAVPCIQGINPRTASTLGVVGLVAVVGVLFG